MTISRYDWAKWYNENATESERLLADRVLRFENLFSDMLFWDDADNGENWLKTYSLLPAHITCFSIRFVHFSTIPPAGYDAFYKHDELTLFVKPECILKDYIVLHEMTHLHESIINDLPPMFHESILWRLYTDLKKQVGRLDEIISNHTNLSKELAIAEIGGVHDLLFLLKSFDLDIRAGYSLGTVFGYGKTDES